MRATLLFAGGLTLLVGACSDKGGNGAPASPPPLNKQLLAGKWKNASEVMPIAGFEFGEDGTLKMTVRGLEQPVPGRYTWSGERTLDLQYQVAEVQKAYQAAAKAYKDQVKERIQTKKLPDKAGPSLLADARDELPAGEKFRVSLTEQPRLLIFVNESGQSQTFE
jgi:hypothetical protein